MTLMSPMSYWMCVLSVLLCMVGVHPASAQDGLPEPVQAMVERGASANVDRATLQSIANRAISNGATAQEAVQLLKPAVDLAETGLPADPVLNKTLEGLAKRVPSPRVESVVLDLAGHVRETAPVVDAWLQQPDVQRAVQNSDAGRNDLIVSGAHVRQRGIPVSEVEALLSEIPELAGRTPSGAFSTRNIASAVRVMAEVPGAAESPALARKIVLSALQAGYSESEIGQLPVAIRHAQSQSQQPLPALTRNVTQAISQGTPAASVLQQLHQGNVPVPGGAAGAVPPGQGKPPDAGRPPDAGPPPDPGKPPGGPPNHPPDGPPGAPGNPPSNPGNPPSNPPGGGGPGGGNP